MRPEHQAWGQNSPNVTLYAVCLVVSSLLLPAASQAQISENVELLAHVDEDGSYSDVWGYTAPGGAEYAIIGTYAGTAFYNVTVPTAPVRVGFIDGPDSIWRDMKTFGQYCYIVSEGTSPAALAGLQIVSLADPESPVLVNVVQDFGSAHNLYIDEQGGRAYVVGQNLGGGGMMIFDLAAAPENPPLVGSYSDFYIHDVYVRNNIAYGAAIYAGRAIILDVTTPGNLIELGNWTYPGAVTHNTWTNESQTLLVTSDETSGGHLNFWDVTDPGNPVFLDDYSAAPDASAHNAIIRNDICYVSYYTEGLRVLSLADPTNVQEVGYYDMHPGGGLYNGDWGVYPFAAEEGIAYLSSIETGLYIVRFDAQFGTLSGTVTDAGTSLPIEGATVTVVEASLVRSTNASGAYTVDLSPGTYTVEVSVFGYEPASAPVTIVASESATLDFQLDALPAGSIAGVVLDSGGSGIEGADITVENTPLATSSAAAGAYSFPSVPTGSYTISAMRFRYAPATAPAVVALSQQTEVDLTLEGAFYWTEMETDPGGWTVSGDATTGMWVRVDPNGTGGGSVQPEDDHTPDPGVQCWVTGQGAVGGGLGDNDVDNGATILTTHVFDLSGLDQPTAEYHRWYTNNAGANPGEDAWFTEISPDGGGSWIVIELDQQSENFWKRVEVDIRTLIPEPTPLDQVRFRFSASDYLGGSIVEAAVDDFQLFDAAGEVNSIVEQAPARTPGLALHRNVPNPFNPRTTIRFELPVASAVRLRIFDPTGRLIRGLFDGRLEAGTHAFDWNGRNAGGGPVASGVYFYRLEAGGLSESLPMVLTR